jgi:hypothetical protein
MANDKAPEGKIFVCDACGRVSRWRYGFGPNGMNNDAEGRCIASHGWDESCVMNASLVDVSELPPKIAARVSDLSRADSVDQPASPV